MSCSRSWAAAALATVVLSGTAFAQSTDEINAGAQFNLTAPGARSLALGGAFLGLADDATAAYTNPAGLTALSKPELSLEARRWNFSSQFTQTGDVRGTIATGSLDDTRSGLSFGSFVYPRGKWAFAAYTSAVSRFAGSIDSVNATPVVLLNNFTLRPVRAHMTLDITNIGASAAGRFGKLSVGAGLSFYKFSLDSRTDRFSTTNRTSATNFQTQVGDDNDLKFNAGLTYKASEKLSLGATYRQGPSFLFDARATYGPAVPPPNVPGTVYAANTGTYRVPDAWGAGLAWRPTQTVVVVLDFTRIMYSQRTADFFDVFVGPNAQNGNFTSQFVADDANQIHFGLEYVLVKMKSPLALRAGVWQDPDHRIHFDGPLNQDNAAYIALFRRGDDAFHVSGGLGIVLQGRYQIDAAVDHATGLTTGSLSAVVRF